MLVSVANWSLDRRHCLFGTSYLVVTPQAVNRPFIPAVLGEFDWTKLLVHQKGS
jgi:hypothetical protein